MYLFNEGYTVAIARSESGKVQTIININENAGHSSLFYDFDGKLRLCANDPDNSW